VRILTTFKATHYISGTGAGSIMSGRSVDEAHALEQQLEQSDDEDGGSGGDSDSDGDEEGEEVIELTSKKETEVVGSLDKIGLVRRSVSDLESETHTLINRIQEFLMKYSVTPSKDRLLAMACNPFTATFGMLELKVQVATLRGSHPSPEILRHAYDHRQMAMDVLEEQIKLICSEIIPKDSTNTGHGSNDEDSDDEDLDAARKRLFIEESLLNTAKVDDPVKQAVQIFFGQKFDPQQVLQDQRRTEVKAEILERIGNLPNEWMKNYQLIAESFDVMDWWERVGKKNHRLIYPVACCILSLPDSNGHQERTFSAATWMDGKLQKRQSDMTFQMKVLLYKNAEFLAKHRRHVQEDTLASAEQRTKELLQLSAQMRNALDVEDSDADDMEAAYDSSPSVT
jgi:hypothetical protein